MDNPSVIDINTLVDINSIKIEQSLPIDEKKHQFLCQIKNPHLYRSGDTVVRVSFAETDVSLADRMKQYLLSKKGLL